MNVSAPLRERFQRRTRLINVAKAHKTGEERNADSRSKGRLASAGQGPHHPQHTNSPPPARLAENHPTPLLRPESSTDRAMFLTSASRRRATSNPAPRWHQQTRRKRGRTKNTQTRKTARRTGATNRKEPEDWEPAQMAKRGQTGKSRKREHRPKGPEKMKKQRQPRSECNGQDRTNTERQPRGLEKRRNKQAWIGKERASPEGQ